MKLEFTQDQLCYLANMCQYRLNELAGNYSETYDLFSDDPELRAAFTAPIKAEMNDVHKVYDLVCKAFSAQYNAIR